MIPIEKLFENEDSSGVLISIPVVRYQKMVEALKAYEAVYPREIPDVARDMIEFSMNSIAEKLYSINHGSPQSIAQLIHKHKKEIAQEAWNRFRGK